MNKQETARRTLEVLERLYEKTGPHLAHADAWQLLVATVLSAQCTDARVNKVTPELFRRLPTPLAFASAGQDELEGLIRSTGFYHNKARHLISAAQKLMRDFGGQVPRGMKELLTLDGVARKTANIVLNGAFGINEGIAVDTHVARISFRLGLTESENPQVIERDLMPLFPQAEWGNLNHRLVSYGRDVCMARGPRCARADASEPCPMLDFCPRCGLAATKQAKGGKAAKTATVKSRSLAKNSKAASAAKKGGN